MPFTKNDPNINRKGAPEKSWTWGGLIRSAMEKKNLDGEEIKHEVANILVAKAMEGDVQALRELGNRLDGLPKQPIAHEGSLELIIRDYAEIGDNTTAEAEGSDSEK